MRKFPPHFTTKPIEKNGKERIVGRPDDIARAQNEALIRTLYNAWTPPGLRDILPPVYMTGGVQGKSILHNVMPHLGNKTFYLMDIKDAFPSVKVERLSEILRGFSWYDFPDPGVTEQYLRRFNVDSKGGLIQGAPASPMLFNMYCFHMDREIEALCKSSGMVYTRYLDDITISAPEGVPLGKKRRKSIRDIVQNYGHMEINHAKSRLHSLDHGPVTITGISIYPDGRCQPSPELFAMVVETFDELEAKMDRSEFITLEDEGRLHGCYGILVSMRNPSQAQLTRLERSLRERYVHLRVRLKSQRQLMGRAATQLSFSGIDSDL